MRRLLNFLSNDACLITYSSMQRLLKAVNFNGLNLITKETINPNRAKVEVMLLKAAQFINKRNDP